MNELKENQIRLEKAVLEVKEKCGDKPQLDIINGVAMKYNFTFEYLRKVVTGQTIPKRCSCYSRYNPNTLNLSTLNGLRVSILDLKELDADRYECDSCGNVIDEKVINQMILE